MLRAAIEDGCPGEDDFAAYVRGGLAPERVRTLDAHVARCSVCRRMLSVLARAATLGSGPADSVAPTLPSEPGTETALQLGARFGRYIVVAWLGAGGMGVVYAAHDPELNRKVALKVLRNGGAGSADRSPIRDALLREAQAMAQLAHPNVVAVFDVGSVDDRVFIAMELVEGLTLRRWLGDARRAPGEILATFLAAGQGLAAAHAAGLIHRDFKPDNVLIGSDGRVRVMDFGLARLALRPPDDAGADDARTAGALTGVAGTLAYMAPEQYLRRTVDARADQFSFAVALYEALYGERPSGALEVATGKPRTGRGPAHPRGVPLAVRQALERALSAEPDERFPSMDGLLAALAPHPRRTRAIAAGALASAIALVAVTGYVVHLRRAAEERTQLVGRLRGLAPDLRTQLRNEHLLPRHDIRPAREKIRAALRDAVRQRETSAGQDEAALVDFVLGEGHLALGDHERALEHLEAAWAGGERGPQIDAALGTALGAVYERKRSEIERTVPVSQRAAPIHDIDVRYRDEAMAHLRAALAGNARAPAYLEAQIAYRERRFADAARIAHTAFADSPTLYEVGMIEARAHDEIALSYNEVNKLAEADAEFAAARQIFARVLEVARSDDEAWLGYAALVNSQASLRARPGGGLDLELRTQAIDALHAAREINRDRWEPYFREAELYIGEGNTEILRYRDPAVYIAQGLPLAEQARAHGADGDMVDALVCQAYWERAVHQGAHGIDPDATYQQAIEACERAVATRSNTENHNSLGIVYGAVADYDGEHGGDPMPMYALAERELRATISIDNDAGLHYNLGRTWTKLARYQAAHGLDPRRTVENALTELENTARRDGRRSDAWSSIADALIARARFLRARREDAQPTLAQARQALERSLAVDAELTSAFKVRMLLAELDAEALLEQRADPTPAVASMRADAGHVLAHLPDDGFAHRMRSRAEVLAARWAIARGGDATPLLARATGDATRAREIDPLDAQAWTISAEVEAVRAVTARTRRTDANAALATGRAFIERAIAIDPGALSTQAVQRAVASHGSAGARSTPGGSAESIERE